jgi:hypothetical protein
MAAPTVATLNSQGVGAYTVLETQVITNQTANSATIVKALSPPRWARYAIFYLNITSMGGTSPLLDFKIETVDPSDFDTSAVTGTGSWDGITQKTAATNSLDVIEIGPDLLADDTGSATASGAYAVRAILPTWLMYTITTDGTTDDEDYTFSLAVEFRK